MIFELAKACNNHKKQPFFFLIKNWFYMAICRTEVAGMKHNRRISNHATYQMFMPLAFKQIISESDGTWQKMRPPVFF